MYKKIYEAQPVYGINPAFLILCLITILIVVLIVVFWGKVDKGVRCLSLAVAFFLLFIITCQVYTAIDAKRKVYDRYIAGEYLTVEGIITDYTLAEEGQPNLPDSFCVDEVNFSVPGFVSAWGYPLKRADGGILENGIYVRIYYIPYKFENVIMKMELLE